MLLGVLAGIVIVFRLRRFMMPVLAIKALNMIIVHTANIIKHRIKDILKHVFFAHRNA